MAPRFYKGQEISEAVVFDTPQPMPLESVFGDLCVLLGGGIVNPYGPTLQLTAAIGPWIEGTDMPVVQAVINPFQQSVYQVGIFKTRALTNPVEILSAFMPAAPGGCPTALLLSPLLSQRPNDIMSLVGKYLAACDAGYRTYQGVKQFPGDHRSRVNNELAAAARRIVAARQGEHADTDNRQLTPEEAHELLSIQLRPQHFIDEWRGFLMCWLESLNRQRDTGLDQEALSYKSVTPLLSRSMDITRAIISETFPS